MECAVRMKSGEDTKLDSSNSNDVKEVIKQKKKKRKREERTRNTKKSKKVKAGREGGRKRPERDSQRHGILGWLEVV